MRVAFMGSPQFSLPPLLALLEADYEVVLVVSRPDRPAGRARRPTPPPVAAFAREQGLRLYQPEHLRTEASTEPLRQAAPEVIVVAAFGLMLPRTVLGLPTHGCLNIHPSLLPRHRGASPIEAALLAGDAETGVSIIQMSEQMDAGPILLQESTPLGPREEAPSLEARLAPLGARLLLEALPRWCSGELKAVPQDETKATYCPKLGRADAELDWQRSAVDLDRTVRALRGRIDAFTLWNNRVLKVLRAEPVPDRVAQEPGRVFTDPSVGRGRLPLVSTGQGALTLLELALEGHAATPGPSFLNGYPAFVGARLGG